MTLGFVGTGAIAAAMVRGLSSPGGLGCAIRLSPRNAELAAALADEYANVAVCASNQEVVDASDTVVIALRRQVAEEVLSALRFTPGQAVISLVATIPVARVAELVRPAARVWRAVPLPSVAQRSGPIALFPAGGAAAELFAGLGQVFGVEAEDHLAAFGAATSTMAAYFTFVGRIASWLAAQGVPEQHAREYMASVFAGLGRTGLEAAHRNYEDLAAAHATPGGLNEQVLRDLTARGLFDALEQALDAVFHRAAG